MFGNKIGGNRMNFKRTISTFFIQSVFIISNAYLLILFLSSCGYVSTSPYLKHIESVSIPRVTIEDPELSYEYEEEITEQLRDTFSSKWHEGSDSILTVTIKDYRIMPIAFDATNNPEEWRISLLLEYKFEDLVKNEIIDQKEDYIYNYDFYVVEGKDEPPETRETATKRMVRELSRDLFGNLAEQW